MRRYYASVIAAGWCAAVRNCSTSGSTGATTGAGGTSGAPGNRKYPSPADAPDSDSPRGRIPDPPIESELDPFRVGYNMGMLSVQLETLRMKLEDNKEVVKTQFASLRDTTRSNHDVLTHTLSDNRGIVLSQLQDNLDKISSRLDSTKAKVTATEDALKELARQHFEASQKHIDDRLENIKDTIKAGILVLAALLVWIIVLLSTSSRGHHNQHSQSPTSPQQFSGSRSGSADQHAAEGHTKEKEPFWKKA